MPDYPRIKSRRLIPISPWMRVIEREVEFTADAKTELYHAVDQQDYLHIVALTPDGRIPIVRQYRPAVETFTWELPAGLVEQGETPADTCRRELKEETGLVARTVHNLGRFQTCTARMSNHGNAFFVETDEPELKPEIEPGMSFKLVTPAEFAGMVRGGEFTLQMHLGAVMLAGMAGFIDLTAFRR